QWATATMPAGASVRTGTEQTSVPAVTITSAVGGPLVTTCSGSRPVTASTVYCQVPEHSGPAWAVATADRPSSPCARSRASTCPAVGCPAQLTAYASGKRGAALDGGMLGNDQLGCGTAGVASKSDGESETSGAGERPAGAPIGLATSEHPAST